MISSKPCTPVGALGKLRFSWLFLPVGFWVGAGLAIHCSNRKMREYTGSTEAFILRRRKQLVSRTDMLLNGWEMLNFIYSLAEFRHHFIDFPIVRLDGV